MHRSTHPSPAPDRTTRSAPRRASGLRRLAFSVALVAVAGCDCEALLASQRGNEPLYRVAGPGEEEAAPVMPERAPVKRVARPRPAPTARTADTPPPPPTTPPGADRLLPVMPSAPPKPPASPEPSDEVHGDAAVVDTRGDSEPSLAPRPWGRGNLQPFGWGHRFEMDVNALRGRPLVAPGADGRPGYVETPMSDGPSMQHVPGAFPDDR